MHTVSHSPRRDYERGFDLYMAEAFGKIAPVNVSSLSRYERQGYEASIRAQAEADFDGLVSRAMAKVTK
jgi:hypothetical protein